MNLTGGAAAVEKVRQDWAPFMELAACEVFEMMLSTRLEHPAGTVEGAFDATSLVGFGGKIRGIVTFSCESKSAALMASKLLRTNVAEGSREMHDALGEICNMVAGNFKTKITSLGDSCMLSTPVVITGKNYSLHALADSAALEVRLLFENMPIAISLRTEG